MVDAVNENVKDDDDDEEEEEEETEDGSMFETMFQSEQDNRHAATNIRCVEIRGNPAERETKFIFFPTTKCELPRVFWLQKRSARRELGRLEQPDQRPRRERRQLQQPRRQTQHGV